ncbi:MAG: aldo/keto reductase [Armatimonadetes bacterium]|nr:aldo/keto reductase [Armatimonadota bacterium]
MRYKKLGKTGLSVSIIGFGAWGIGGGAYGPVDDDVSAEALLTAYEKGINFFDTADVYGDGHSEEMIGKALHHVRNSVALATKVGTFPHFGFDMPQDFSPNHIRSSIEHSLRRLRTDHIDLYQLHSPPGELLRQSDRIAETLGAMEALKKEGKVRHTGISTRSPEDGLFAARDLGVEVVQVNFNLIDHRAIENGLLTFCEKAGVGVIARTPFAFGFLTGKYSQGARFYPPDHRSNWPQEQIDCWAEAPHRFASLNADSRRTMSQLALLFCTAHDVVSTAIPGIMKSSEALENISAAALPPLTKEEILRISEIYQRNTFYVGRKSPSSGNSHSQKREAGDNENTASHTLHTALEG